MLQKPGVPPPRRRPGDPLKAESRMSIHSSGSLDMGNNQTSPCRAPGATSRARRVSIGPDRPHPNWNRSHSQREPPGCSRPRSASEPGTEVRSPARTPKILGKTGRKASEFGSPPAPGSAKGLTYRRRVGLPFHSRTHWLSGLRRQVRESQSSFVWRSTFVSRLNPGFASLDAPERSFDPFSRGSGRISEDLAEVTLREVDEIVLHLRIVLFASFASLCALL